MNVTELLLTLVVQYTPFFVPISMFLGGVGLPLPNSMITIVLGTLMQQQLLAPQSLSWLVIVPTIAGDSIGFLLARKVLHSQKFARITRFLQLHTSATEQTTASRFFSRFGHWSILLSRFAVTPLAIPINLVAASTNYPFKLFLLIDAVGEIIWAITYATIGYFFGIYWQSIYQLINNFVGMLSMLIVIAVLLTIRTRRKKRTLLKARAESDVVRAQNV